MGLHYLLPGLLDLPRLLVEYVSSLPFEPPEHFFELAAVPGYVVTRMLFTTDDDDVQLGVGAVGQVHRRPKGQLRFLGSVGG